MRLWSIHPQYLDSMGLVAVWREGLLAQHVLEGKTKGYTNHPQLNRFKASNNPIDQINGYLAIVAEEATRRGYSFDTRKIGSISVVRKMKVNSGQIEYEWAHLLKKLKVRSEKQFMKSKDLKVIEPHPLFEIIDGDIEPWEITK